MEITAKQSVFDKIVKRADPFTAKDLGSSDHLHAILVEVDAEAGTVRFTAESDASAIEFVVGEDIDIQESGRILIDSIRLRTVLSVIPSDERVTIKTLSEKAASVTGGRTIIRVPIKLIEDTNALLPKVQNGAKDGVKLSSEDFKAAFNIGVVAHDTKGSRPSLNSVHISFIPGKGSKDKGKLRFLSFNGSATAFATSDIQKIDADEFVTLVEPLAVRASIEYIDQGTSVILTEGKGQAAEKQLHITVIKEDKNGDAQTLYHIRLNTLSGGHGQYPAAQIFDKTQKIFEGANTSFSVDHGGLLRLFRSAERISSLNHQGRSKDVEVGLNKNDIRIAVSGETDFEDFIELKEWSGEKDSFIFRWGLYGDALETYPGDSDLQIGVIRANDRIVALALVDDPDIKFDGKSFPENYLAIIPTANPEAGAVIRRN